MATNKKQGRRAIKQAKEDQPQTSWISDDQVSGQLDLLGLPDNGETFCEDSPQFERVTGRTRAERNRGNTKTPPKWSNSA